MSRKYAMFICEREGNLRLFSRFDDGFLWGSMMENVVRFLSPVS